MAYQAIPPASGGTSLSIRAAESLDRARQLLGSSINKVFGTDFDTIATVANAGTVNATLSTSEDNVIVCSTGAGAGSTVIVRPTGVGEWINNLTTSAFAARFRAKITTTIDANSYVAMSVNNVGVGAGGLFIGGLGSRSTANFTYDFYNTAGAATVNGSLGVALDTSYHVFEIVNNLTNYYVYIDGVQRLSVAIPAATTNSAGIRIDSGNGATAANQQINVDYMYMSMAG